MNGTTPKMKKLPHRPYQVVMGLRHMIAQSVASIPRYGLSRLSRRRTGSFRKGHWIVDAAAASSHYYERPDRADEERDIADMAAVTAPLPPPAKSVDGDDDHDDGHDHDDGSTTNESEEQ
jgi:hypothetical protein